MQRVDNEACVAHTMIPYSKGIICGENQGLISLYEYNTEDRAHITYRRTHSVKVDDTNAQVCGVSLSEAEDMLICALSNSQLSYFSFEDVDELSATTMSTYIQTQVPI